MSQNLMGAIRLKHIFKLYNIDAGPNSDGAVQKYKREEDMLNRVLAVFAAVGSKVPLSIFDNDYIKAYIHQLDPKHRQPHQLERTRIVEVIMDLGMLEFKQIVNERRDELGNSFVSVTTDFWTDSHRKEQFGALVADIVAGKYTMDDGRKFFMSRKTAKRIEDNILSDKVCTCIYYVYILYPHLVFSSSPLLHSAHA